MLRERLEQVRGRIAQACERSGRPASSVVLVGVTKQVPLEAIREAVALGLTDLGENRVQEARIKISALGSGFRALGHEPSAPSPQPIRWHLIGHLQRNKAKVAVELFHAIHSVDSVELVGELERHAANLAQGSRLPPPVGGVPPEAGKAEGKDHKAIEVFVQVNVAGETTKFGCSPNEVQSLADAIMSCSHLKLAGFMTMAPFSDKPETARPVFRQLRELRDALVPSPQPSAPSLKLSMGMSHDFEVAIEEGADVVRIGSAIFRDSLVMK